MTHKYQAFVTSLPKPLSCRLQRSVSETPGPPSDAFALAQTAVLRSDGYIATAAHVLGTNSEWRQKDIDGVLLRKIEVRMPDQHGVLEQQWREAFFFKDNPHSVGLKCLATLRRPMTLPTARPIAPTPRKGFFSRTTRF